MANFESVVVANVNAGMTLYDGRGLAEGVANEIIITLESGKELRIYATAEEDVLSFATDEGVNIRLRMAKGFQIELK